MSSHRKLVEQALVLLRQTRAELAGDHDRRLVDSIDEVIGLLESSDMNSDHVEVLSKVLDVLGKGMATIQAIQQFIDGM